MFDRYDRDDGGRSRGDSFERYRGLQAGGDRDGCRLWLDRPCCPGTNPVCAPLDSTTSSPERIGTEENEPLTARPTWLQDGGVMEDCHGDAECKEFA